MPRLEYFLVAESLAVDQTTNQASVFNIIDEIRTQDFPTFVPQMAAIACWNLEQADIGQEFQATLRIVPPVGEARDQRINFTGTRIRQRIILRIVGFQIAGPGMLRLEIHLNGQHQASHTVTVMRADAAETAL